MRLWLRNASFLLFVASSLGVVGRLSAELYELLALLSFAVFLGTFGREVIDPRSAGRLQLAGAFILGG